MAILPIEGEVEVLDPDELEMADSLDCWLRSERRSLLSCENVLVACTSALCISRSTTSMLAIVVFPKLALLVLLISYRLIPQAHVNYSCFQL